MGDIISSQEDIPPSSSIQNADYLNPIFFGASDLDVMARTVFGESRGELWAGQVAIGFVILNRLQENSWFGKTIKEVCLKPLQFSCWNANDPNKDLVTRVTSYDHSIGNVFRLCLAAAAHAISGQERDFTNGATHYHTAGVSPSWSSGLTPVASIGNHLFYKGVK